MKKAVKGRKFHRKKDQREALMRSLAEALIKNERIETTEAKAKELRPFIERLVTKSRNDTLHARRMLNRQFTGEVSEKLLKEIGPRYKERPGGYTRIVKRGVRTGDAAKRAIIEFVDKE